MDYYYIQRNMLFDGVDLPDIQKMMGCLSAEERSYEKGEIIVHAGQRVKRIGIILKGVVRVEHVDSWGDVAVIGMRTTGKTIGESYACLPAEIPLENVVANEDCQVVYLDAEKLMLPCQCACPCHRRVASNLTRLLALRNIGMSHRAVVTAPKSIRGKVLAFLSYQAHDRGKNRFTVPFSRQQMAEYLGVDRSALSAELARMQKDRLIQYHMNEFVLLTKDTPVQE